MLAKVTKICIKKMQNNHIIVNNEVTNETMLETMKKTMYHNMNNSGASEVVQNDAKMVRWYNIVNTFGYFALRQTQALYPEMKP